MHDYISRNGVTEQTRYLRSQPYRMRNVPFDFEEREHDERTARVEKIVVLICAIGLVAILTKGWVW